MITLILKELKSHSPFTIFGAFTGILLMIVVQGVNTPYRVLYSIFYTLHPLHVFLSALVTSSIYELHKKGKLRLWSLIIIGYVGSVGIATLSDSIMPYTGEILLNLPHRELHLGFIEKWWLVNPLAFIGILVAYFKPSHKFSHAGHVLISTWASLFHIVMALGGSLDWVTCAVIFFFLFISVWIPCCVSDFVFPLLFVKEA